MLSAQFVELSAPCLDEYATTTSIESAADHDADHEDMKEHHCHKACAQCHSVISVPAIASFDSNFYSDEISYFSIDLPLNDYQLSVDRPPAFVV